MNKIIETKIKEHEAEMEATIVESDKIKAGLEKAQSKGVHALMLESNKMLVLKDKILFHKAAILTLKDVLESIGE